MYKLPRTATLFQLENNNFVSEFLQSVKPQEQLEVNNLEDNILHLKFEWLEPLKVNGKIVKKVPLHKDMLFFTNNNTLAILGEFEHILNMIQEKLSSQLKVVSVFDFYKKNIKEESNTMKVVSVTVNSSEFRSTDSEKMKNLKVDYLKHNSLIDCALPIMHSYLVKTEDNNSFKIEHNNMIMFYDTSEDDVVINVLEKISADIEELLILST